MINDRKSLQEYLEADKKALGRDRNKPAFSDYIWKYEILLRKCEYYSNCRKDVIGKLIGGFYRDRKSRMGYHTGIAIPINVIGKGLCIPHLGPIIINEQAYIGENCRIHVGVNIGADARKSTYAPTIGNNVYIAPGVKMFGKIVIADNIAIGANAVVNKSFLEPNVSIAGVPAKVVNHEGVKDIIKSVEYE